MSTMNIGIVGSSNPGRYKKLNAEATYNMIMTDVDEGVRSLVPYAGYKAVKEILSSGDARGMYMSPNGDLIIAIYGNGVYQITASTDDQGNNLIFYGQVGLLNTYTGNTYIAENEKADICIVDGIFIYYYNYLNSTFQSIDATQLSGEGQGNPFSPGHVAYQDGYFIFADSSTNQFRMCDLVTPTLFPAVYTGAIQTKNASKCVAVSAHGRQLFVFGKTVTEIYYDNPDQNTGVLVTMPYQRDNSINIDYGCLNQSTVKSGFGMVVWVGISEISNPVILVSYGGSPEVISTDGINFLMSTLTNPTDCYAFLFQQDGHIFYQLTFNSDNLTLLLDFKTKKFFYATDENLNKHIAKYVVYYHNTHYFLSNKNNLLYEMSSSIYNYDGMIIPRIRICKQIRKSNYRLVNISEVGVLCDSGYEVTNTDIDTLYHGLKILFSFSRDGGYSFSGSVAKQIGCPLGKRERWTRWNSHLGAGSDYTFKFLFQGDNYFAIVDGYAEVDGASPIN